MVEKDKCGSVRKNTRQTVGKRKESAGTRGEKRREREEGREKKWS